MKTCSKCGIEKSLESFKKNKQGFQGRYSVCKECCSKKNAERYLDNRERILLHQKQYHKENKSFRNAYSKRHYQNNREFYLEKTAKRRIFKMRATVVKDNFLINWYYMMASWLTKATGEQHHVDHIVPLQHDKVCGLHVPANLQILTAYDNLSKGNKYEI